MGSLLDFLPVRPVHIKRSAAIHASSAFLCVLLYLIATASRADAGFIGYYSPANFTLTNSGGLFPNGSASFPDSSTLILTGTNDGSGLPGNTELTIPSGGNGLFEFTWAFNTLDTPTFEQGGYVLGGNFFPLADTDGQFSSVPVQVSVTADEVIGFEVLSVDDTGSPGILTVTEFSAPSPEPGTLVMLLFVVGAALIHWRGRLRFLLGTTPVVPAVVIGVLGMTMPIFAQQRSYTGASVTGQLTLATVVNLTQQTLASEGAQTPVAPGTAFFKAPGPLLHPPRAAKKSLGGSQINGSGTVALTVVPGSGLVGINGISHQDQRFAFGGNQFSVEPPNPSVAAGNGYVLEAVNNALEVYNTSGSPVLPKVLALNQVFGLAPAINRTTGVNGVFLTDTRVFFDAGINRWFVVDRSQDNDAAGNPLNSSHLYIAVSQTGDPTANFNVYVMNTTNAGHQGCPCLDDYPQLGADQFGFHIAWNEFNIPSQQFLDAAVMSISKQALASGVANPTAYQFLLPFNTGFEFALQPATTSPGAANYVASGGIEFFVSTSGNFTSDNELGVWAMSNISSLATGASNPTMFLVAVPGPTYIAPGVASQPSGPIPLGSSQGEPIEFLDGGDSRVQCLSYAGAKLYLTFATQLIDANGRSVVGGAYVVLAPTFRGGVLAAQVVNQGYLSVTGNHLLRPALAVNASGAGAIAVTLVGNVGNYYPSAAVIPFQTFTQPTTLEIVAQGTFPEDGFSGYPIGGGSGVARWGDTNTAFTAADGSIWMATQYVASLTDANAGNYANWNTWLTQLHPN